MVPSVLYITTLSCKTIYLSYKTTWNSEKHPLKNTLQCNGYSKRPINKVLRIQRDKFNSQNTRELYHKDIDYSKQANLPYIKGSTDKIGRVMRKHEIKPVFKPQKQINDLLGSWKGKIPLLTPGVYEIPCSLVYFGDAKRRITTGVNKHIRSRNQFCSAGHRHVPKHVVLCDETRVLATTPHYFLTIVRDAAELRKQENDLNRDDSFQ